MVAQVNHENVKAKIAKKMVSEQEYYSTRYGEAIPLPSVPLFVAVSCL